MADNKMVSLEGMKVAAQQSKAYTDQKFSELQYRFDVLSDEYCIYTNAEDSDGTTIEDSDGDTVIGKLTFSMLRLISPGMCIPRRNTSIS